MTAMITPIQAHQPRIVEGGTIEVTDPEISKAYYGQLDGSPHLYTIHADKDFDLYVSILVPDAKSPKKDVWAEVFKKNLLLSALGGSGAKWVSFFEPFGQSTYWEGGEYKARVEAGVYTVKVSSPDNDSKYSLAIGETEKFDIKETLNALKSIPHLKRDFFDESPIGFVKSPFGWGYILVVYLCAFGVGLLYRTILKRVARGTVRGLHRNIGGCDRVIRLAVWLGLLFWAMMTLWSPWLLFFSGFALFEALFSWCGFYAAIGKNTCPV